MSMENPEILWAQSRVNIFLTIIVNDLKQHKIVIEENYLILQGEINDGELDLKLEFFKNINKNESKWRIYSNKIEFLLVKEIPIFWNKFSNIKYNNLKIDWNKWQDEDDSEGESNKSGILKDFSDFTKTLPSELMEKDFTELFPDDFSPFIEDGYEAEPSSEENNVDIDSMISKMEEGLITDEDRESISSPES